MSSPFAPGVGLQPLTWRRFSISLARNADEVDAALRLRHEVFQREWRGAGIASGLDEDDFDARCDHMLITDQRSGVLVGTYRFNHSRRGRQFYSAGEFAIGEFASRPGNLVEMGRACLRREWRNNMAMIALGRGIAWYARTMEVDWLFGCSSVITSDPQDAAILSRWLGRHGHLFPEGEEPRPHRNTRLPGFYRALSGLGTWDETDDRRAEELLPPLLRFYLEAGAKVAIEPSYDPEFACLDYFTALPWKEANPAVVARYC